MKLYLVNSYLVKTVISYNLSEANMSHRKKMVFCQIPVSCISSIFKHLKKQLFFCFYSPVTTVEHLFPWFRGHIHPQMAKLFDSPTKDA